MSDNNFFLSRPVAKEAMTAAVAKHFGLSPDRVFVFQGWEETVADRLTGVQHFRLSAVHVQLMPIDVPVLRGELFAWFTLARTSQSGPHDTDFDDRALARDLAASLGQMVLFRDPVPDPRDPQQIEAAQIGVAPDGTETAMWMLEYGQEDGDAVGVRPRSELN